MTLFIGGYIILYSTNNRTFANETEVRLRINNTFNN